MKKILLRSSVFITLILLFVIALLSSSCNCDTNMGNLTLYFGFPDGLVDYSTPVVSKMEQINTHFDTKQDDVKDIPPPSLYSIQSFALGTCHGAGTIECILIYYCGAILPDHKPPRIKAQYDSGQVTKPKLDCNSSDQYLNINMYEVVKQNCGS